MQTEGVYIQQRCSAEPGWVEHLLSFWSSWKEPCCLWPREGNGPVCELKGVKATHKQTRTHLQRERVRVSTTKWSALHCLLCHVSWSYTVPTGPGWGIVHDMHGCPVLKPFSRSEYVCAESYLNIYSLHLNILSPFTHTHTRTHTHQIPRGWGLAGAK